MDCLQMLDPANPGLVLSDLPEEILDEMLKYAGRYDPRRPRSIFVRAPSRGRPGQDGRTLDMCPSYQEL